MTRKEELKALKKQYREDIRAIKKEYPSEGFFSKIKQSFNNGMLATLEKAERKAAFLRYKKENPDGAEAEELLNQFNKMVIKYQKILEKGRVLGKKELQQLQQARICLVTMKQKSLGRDQEKIAKTLSSIDNIVPNDQDLFDLFVEVLQGTVK